ncbi:MAG: hypothetical protein PF689_11720 [Deltaproteobacteria bacterium]|jgi:hypothetical protein|nr:hypothetical protein [Deltaproteobacteria bacterium]
METDNKNNKPKKMEKTPQENSPSEKKQKFDLEETKKVLNYFKKFTHSTWGMRISLIIIGFVIFFIAYFFGSLGKNDLRSKIEDKKEEILICKKNNDKIIKKKEQQEKENNILRNKLSDTKNRMQFLKQREKIRKPLHNAFKTWKKGSRTETVENLYSAIINLKTEASSSIGISRYFYDVIINKLKLAITIINNVCIDKKPAAADNSLKIDLFADTNKKQGTPPGINSENCQDKINKIIVEALDILPPPN